MSSDATMTIHCGNCGNCGNDSFHLVTEARLTEIVRVAPDASGKLRWSHDGHPTVPVEDGEFERRIECTSCLRSPNLAPDDPLRRGIVGVSREVLVNTIAANPDTIDLQTALMMITGADIEEILSLAENHGTVDQFKS